MEYYNQNEHIDEQIKLDELYEKNYQNQKDQKIEDDEDMKDGELDSYDPMLNPGDTIYVGTSDDDEDFSQFPRFSLKTPWAWRYLQLVSFMWLLMLQTCVF